MFIDHYLYTYISRRARGLIHRKARPAVWLEVNAGLSLFFRRPNQIHYALISAIKKLLQE